MNLTCPRCHDHHVRRSQRRIHDFFFRLFGLVPYRCNSCKRRFFRARQPLRSNATT